MILGQVGGRVAHGQVGGHVTHGQVGECVTCFWNVPVEGGKGGCHQVLRCEFLYSFS